MASARRKGALFPANPQLAAEPAAFKPALELICYYLSDFTTPLTGAQRDYRLPWSKGCVLNSYVLHACNRQMAVI